MSYSTLAYSAVPQDTTVSYKTTQDSYTFMHCNVRSNIEYFLHCASLHHSSFDEMIFTLVRLIHVYGAVITIFICVYLLATLGLSIDSYAINAIINYQQYCKLPRTHNDMTHVL